MRPAPQHKRARLWCSTGQQTTHPDRAPASTTHSDELTVSILIYFGTSCFSESVYRVLPWLTTYLFSSSQPLPIPASSFCSCLPSTQCPVIIHLSVLVFSFTAFRLHRNTLRWPRTSPLARRLHLPSLLRLHSNLHEETRCSSATHRWPLLPRLYSNFSSGRRTGPFVPDGLRSKRRSPPMGNRSTSLRLSSSRKLDRRGPKYGSRRSSSSVRQTASPLRPPLPLETASGPSSKTSTVVLAQPWWPR